MKNGVFKANENTGQKQEIFWEDNSLPSSTLSDNLEEKNAKKVDKTTQTKIKQNTKPIEKKQFKPKTGTIHYVKSIQLGKPTEMTKI